MKPEVLLMDEPTSALDPGSTMKVEELMSELKKNYTVVIVTHNMQQAARISDRTAFFLLGELVEVAPRRRSSAHRRINAPRTTFPVGSVKGGNSYEYP